MRKNPSTFLAAFLSALLGGSLAFGQMTTTAMPGATIAGDYGGSAYGLAGVTPAGSFLQGIAEVVRSEGYYNLDTARAAVAWTEAQRNAIQNAKDWEQAYFERRRMNREYRAQEAPRRPTMEDLVRYAQMGRPQRLSPSDLDSVTGELYWPMLLRSPALAQHRTELEQIFSRRAETGGLSPQDYFALYRVIDLMWGDLRSRVREVVPADYVLARNFLDSLAYEGRLPSG